MVLELFQKLHLLIYASQFVHDIINYPTFIYPIESGKCGKKKKKLQQFWYLKKKELFRWNEKFFIVFEGLSLVKLSELQILELRLWLFKHVWEIQTYIAFINVNKFKFASS